MVELDIKRVNQNSPYEIYKVKGFYSFTTEFGIEYVVRFDEDDLVQCDQSYQFSLLNISNKPSPRDSKLRKTIIAIISEFFTVCNATMLYICETGDGKQGMRSRLFEYWFNTFEFNSKFMYFHTTITDLEGVTNYISLILRNDNPNLKAVANEWVETIQLMTNKP